MALYKIVMSDGPTPGKVFELSETEITVGRDIHAGIVINVPEVSRRHARFRLDPGGYVLEDLGSTNGTFVNGQRLVAPTLLRSGDTIRFGEAITLMFEGGEFDADATVVSAAGSGRPASQAATMIAHDPLTPAPEPAYQVPATGPAYQSPQFSSPGSAFSGQVPAGPSDFGDELYSEEPKSRTWLWAGLGCLVVLLCGCVAGAILFDMMDMYCQPPFDSLLSFLYTCP
jgi:predicted component of type VI protein secretion system